MKKVRSILSHLVNQPQFKILKKQSCYHKFIEHLPPRFKKAIAFIYIKNNILFIAISHPGYKMELNYNKDLLRSLLNMMGTHDEECSELKANSVILFNSKFHIKEPVTPQATDPKYRELSSGEFKIKSKDKEILKKFEKIKQIIVKNRVI